MRASGPYCLTLRAAEYFFVCREDCVELWLDLSEHVGGPALAGVVNADGYDVVRMPYQAGQLSAALHKLAAEQGPSLQ